MSWSAPRAFVATILTCGILPTVRIPSWLRHITAQHQQQFWHLGEWLRLQTNDPDSAEMQQLSHRIHVNHFLAGLMWLFISAAITAMATFFAGQNVQIRDLYRFAFGRPISPNQLIFLAGISLAAACNWIQIILHQRSVQRCLSCFNRIAARNGFDALPEPKLELGFSPLWIIAGMVLAAKGAVWALPVMLAAAAHRRYTMVGSVRIRAMLAERVRQMLLQRRPSMRVPQPVTIVRSCIRPNCQAPLASIAVFCPRCGTRAAKSMEIVA
jgi:hypothetical protein